jgi:hypothetical protein
MTIVRALAPSQAAPGSTAINVQLSLDETYADITPVRRAGAVSAFLSIMRGCNNMCAPCQQGTVNIRVVQVTEPWVVGDVQCATRTQFAQQSDMAIFLNVNVPASSGFTLPAGFVALSTQDVMCCAGALSASCPSRVGVSAVGH